MERRLLSTDDAAAYLSLSRSQLQRLRKSGGFPRPIKLSADLRSKCLFDRRDLDAWIDRQKGNENE